MDVTAEVLRRGGVARTRQLLLAGCSERAIAAALRRGAVARPVRGVICLPDAEAIDVLAARVGAEHACVSALSRRGLPVPTAPPRPHLAVSSTFTSSGRDLAGARLHYTGRRLEPGAVASVRDALDEAGACMSPLWHLAAVDAALHGGHIGAPDIASFTRSSRDRRAYLLSHCDARAESPAETFARVRLVSAGLRVRPQAYVNGVGRVDLEVEGRLLLEIDGAAYHSDREAFVRDRRRDRMHVRAGRTVMRFAAAELLAPRPVDVVEEVTAALRAQAHHGR